MQKISDLNNEFIYSYNSINELNDLENLIYNLCNISNKPFKQVKIVFIKINKNDFNSFKKNIDSNLSGWNIVTYNNTFSNNITYVMPNNIHVMFENLPGYISGRINIKIEYSNTEKSELLYAINNLYNNNKISNKTYNKFLKYINNL